MLTWPVRSLGRMIAEMSKAGVSIERIRYIMNSPVEQDKPDAVTPDMNGDIAFENVTFAYADTPASLYVRNIHTANGDPPVFRRQIIKAV